MLYRNLLIVFVLCGFWHGASWNFMIWGLLHGALLVVERIGFSRVLAHAPHVIGRVYTLFGVAIGWVFFRVETLPGAVRYLAAMFGQTEVDAKAQPLAYYADAFSLAILLAAMLGSTPLVARWCRAQMHTLSLGVRSTVVVASVFLLFTCCTVLVAAGSYNPFIYFRF